MVLVLQPLKGRRNDGGVGVLGRKTNGNMYLKHLWNITVEKFTDKMEILV